MGTKSSRRRTTNGQLSDLIVFAECHGWTVEKTSGGHLKWIPPERGQRFVITSSSPSDRRSFLNDRSNLRQSGLPREGSP